MLVREPILFTEDKATTKYTEETASINFMVMLEKISYTEVPELI